MKPDSTPLLLHFRASHYNEKVRWALDRKRIAHRREALIPGFHVVRVRRLSGQNQVPVLKIGERVIAGSDRILEALEQWQPDPPLFPSDAAPRRRVLEIQAYFDTQVAPQLRRLAWASYRHEPALSARFATAGFPDTQRRLWRAARPLLWPVMSLNMGLDARSVAHARAQLTQHFDYLESRIGPHGYLVGDRFTAADLTAAALFTPLVRPPQFPYPTPEPVPAELAELRASVASRPGARWVHEIYARERDASCEITDQGHRAVNTPPA